MEDLKLLRFRRFHADNPHVADRLIAMARGLKDRGFRRWGICNLWEKLRYDLAMETKASDFRFNDHYKPYYARLLMQMVPELDGLFETRKQIPI